MKTLKDYISTDIKSLDTSLSTDIKSLETLLYEASLLDIEGTIEVGNNEADKLTVFGKRFTLYSVQNYTSYNVNALFKKSSLKKLTNNMNSDHIDDKIIFNNNVLKMFITLLDNITFKEIGIPYNVVTKNMIYSDDFRTLFSNKLKEYLIKNNVLNHATVYCPHSWVCTDNEFRIVVDSNINNSVIQLKYKIN